MTWQRVTLVFWFVWAIAGGVWAKTVEMDLSVGSVYWDYREEFSSGESEAERGWMDSLLLLQGRYYFSSFLLGARLRTGVGETDYRNLRGWKGTSEWLTLEGEAFCGMEVANIELTLGLGAHSWERDVAKGLRQDYLWWVLTAGARLHFPLAPQWNLSLEGVGLLLLNPEIEIHFGDLPSATASTSTVTYDSPGVAMRWLAEVGYQILPQWQLTFGVGYELYFLPRSKAFSVPIGSGGVSVYPKILAQWIQVFVALKFRW